MNMVLAAVLSFVLPSSASASVKATAGKQDDLARTVERLKTDDPAERRRAQDELLARGAEGVTAALRALEASAPDPGPEVARLVGQLASPKWRERDEAMRGIVKLGRPAKAALEARAKAGDAEVAWRVRAALAEIQELAGREEAKDDSRNLAICELLGETGDRRAVTPVLKFLAGPPDQRPELKLRAAAAAGRLREQMEPAQAEEAAERVLAMLERPSGALQKGILLRALGRLRSAQAVRPLAALAADRSEKNVHVKIAALGALAEGGDPRGLKAVVDALLAEDPYVRQGAAAALERLSGAALGYDPRGSIEDNRAAIEKARTWWAKKTGKDWED